MKQRNYGPKLHQAVRSPAERNVLVEANLDLPRKVVAHLWWRSVAVRRMGWDDASQAGNLLLIRAADLWNDRLGCFRAYAWTTCVKTLPGVAARDNSLIVVKTAGKKTPWPLTGIDLSWCPERDDSGERADRLDAMRARVESVLVRMPEEPERAWLERRMEGLSRWEAWAAIGKPRRSMESVEAGALRKARELAKVG